METMSPQGALLTLCISRLPGESLPRHAWAAEVLVEQLWACSVEAGLEEWRPLLAPMTLVRRGDQRRGGGCEHLLRGAVQPVLDDVLARAAGLVRVRGPAQLGAGVVDDRRRAQCGADLAVGDREPREAGRLVAVRGAVTGLVAGAAGVVLWPGARSRG